MWFFFVWVGFVCVLVWRAVFECFVVFGLCVGFVLVFGCWRGLLCTVWVLGLVGLVGWFIYGFVCVVLVLGWWSVMFLVGVLLCFWGIGVCLWGGCVSAVSAGCGSFVFMSRLGVGWVRFCWSAGLGLLCCVGVLLVWFVQVSGF